MTNEYRWPGDNNTQAERALALEELQRETLVEKNRRLRQTKCKHEEVYSSSVTGPEGTHTTRFCLDCGKLLLRI
jgi:hypothetical protein